MIDLMHEIKRELDEIEPSDLWERIRAEAADDGAAATLDPTAAHARRRPTMWVAVAAVIALLALVGALAVLDDDQTVGTTPATQPTRTPATLPSIPLDEGPPLRAGTYRVSSEGLHDVPGADSLVWSIVDYTITIPEGWNGHTGHYLSKHEDGDDELDTVGLYPVLVDEIFADPCPGEAGATVAVGPEVNDLVDALIAQPGPSKSEPVETTIGGLPATRVDLEIPEGADLTSCRLAPGLQIWFSEASDAYFVLMPGYTASIYAVDVDGERQVFLTQHGPEASDEDLRELQSMLDSIRID
ncbi:MAG: hypothetical protein ACJ739_02670 [Acidimicrobiales bacterium]